MHRLALLTATATAALAGPAAAQAASGVVLSVDGHHHALEVVDSAHHLHSLHYRGSVAHLRPGAKVSFSGSSLARRLRVVGHGATHVSYVAHVVRSSRHGVVLALANGQHLSFASSQVKRRVVHHRSAKPRHAADARAAAVTVNVLGLQPGQTVVVDESVDAAGDVTITITLPAPSTTTTQGTTGGDQSAGGDDQSTGDDGNSGSDESGGGDQAGGGDQSGGGDGSGNDPTQSSDPATSDLQGTVTDVSAGSLTVAPSDGSPAQTFTADPTAGMFDGIAVGDAVDVTFHVVNGQTVVDNVDDNSGD